MDNVESMSRAELVFHVRRLDALVNSPHTLGFLEGTRLEVAHQVERWGTVHDRAKQPADWFWLVGYLAGKALQAHVSGNVEKALHHTISSSAALANWHAAISLADTRMAPGSADLHQFIEQTFGVRFLSKEVYYISDLPSDLQMRDVVTIGSVSLILGLLATLYPSYRASRVNPAEALRYE